MYTGRPISYWVWGQKVPVSDVLHFRGLTMPGEYRGLDPMTYLERTIGNLIAQDESAVEMLVSGGLQQGYIKHPGTPPPDAVDDTKQAWADSVAGRDRTPPVFTGGLEFQPVTYDPAAVAASRVPQIQRPGVVHRLRGAAAACRCPVG